jgi:SNF2 family DNA or RNA helicase
MPIDFKPRDYQRSIIEFMVANERANIWAGMGTGKGSAALTALQGISLIADPFPVLVLGPLRVAAGVWPSEVAKWSHLIGLSIASWAGTRDFTGRVSADICTVNYDNIEALVEHLGDAWPFKTVIADESSRLQGFRVTQGTKRAQSLGRVAHKRVKRFYNLTGTPASNGLHGVWGQQWFLDGGARLGRSFSAFENRWFATKRRPGQKFGGEIVLVEGAQAEIESRLRDCTITVRASDYMDLPPLIENVIEVDLPPAARRHYRELERELFTKLADGTEVEAFNAAALTQKVLQAANGALYVDDKGSWRMIHDAKLEALASVIEEAGGAPVLCSYQFKSDLARILKAFPKAVELRSQVAIDAFSRGEIQLGVGHPASMGHGVDGLQ